MRKSNQGDVPQLVRCGGHCADDAEPKLLDHPPLTADPLLAERPGGGPRDLGAPHNSAVTAVDGFKSPKPPFVFGSLICGLHQIRIVLIQFNKTRSYNLPSECT